MRTKSERRIIKGVVVRRITVKEEAHYLQVENHYASSRFHVYHNASPKHPDCFLHLFISPKNIRALDWISHFVSPKRQKGKAICTISFKDGTYWKAPSHAIGKCPFFNYHQEEK